MRARYQRVSQILATPTSYDAAVPSQPRAKGANRKGLSMKMSALIAGAVIALSASIATAQTSNFDSRKFFERLQLEGASVPTSFDAKKFFEKLAAEGASSKAPLSAEEFFEKLRAEGASVPASLDGKTFINTIRSEGMTPPDLVVPNK